MNFEAILGHHLLDHTFFPMFEIGAVKMGMSKHLVMMWIVVAVLLLILIPAANGKGKLSRLLRGIVEPIVLYIRDSMLKPIFHDATSTYLPYFLTLFFFVLTANLLGLVPYSSTITGNISVTFALASCTFGLIQFAGIKEQGPVEYVKHICPGGLPFWLVPMIFMIEVAGMFAKCTSLCIRLFANMIAGHIVSLAFLCLIFIFAEMHPLIGLGVAPGAIGLALFVYVLDLLISLLQAYIFTFLTALFVGGAVHPH